MANHIALAQLVSFGSMVFSGGGAPTGTDNLAGTLAVLESVDRPIHAGPSLLFPTTDYGYGIAPLKTATLSAQLVMTAVNQSDGLLAYQALEDGFGGWWNAWTSSYLWGANSSSGQVGEVCVLDTSGTTYVGQAELLVLESKNRPGAPADQQIALVFSLLTPLAAGTPATVGAPTGTAHLPTMTLVSFGPLVFTGGGAPAQTNNGSAPLNVRATARRPRHASPDNQYGVNVLGLSAGPLTQVEMSTTLSLMAAGGLSQAATFQAVEDAWNLWNNQWLSRYSFVGSTVTGQVGYLVVQDSHGVSWKALAELVEWPITTKPGEIALVEIPLTFRLLEQFGSVAPPPGPIIDTVVGTGVEGSTPFPTSVAPLSMDANFTSGAGTVCYDSTGVLYFTMSNEVYKLAADGSLVTLYAGNVNDTAGDTGDGGAAVGAEMHGPQGMTVDGSDHLFIAEQGGGRIRRVDAGTGHISTYKTGFTGPLGCCFDSAGALLVADAFANKVMKIASGGGSVTTFAGTGTAGYSGDGAAATSAKLNFPSSIWCDSLDNVFIGDSNNNVVRRVDHTTGFITTYAGGGVSTAEGVAATSAVLATPWVYIKSDVLYISEMNFGPDRIRVRKVPLLTGLIQTVAGAGPFGFSGDGGDPLLATFFGFNGAVSLSPSGTKMAIADQGNDRIRVVTGL